MRVCAACPAKVNLFLDVRGRRADGYHEIESVFVPLPSLADRIDIALDRGDGIRLSCAHPDVPDDESNLCWKAADAFACAAQIRPCWTLTLTKSIPVAAGLGGGSSDAAAVLRTLNQVHDHPLSARELHAIARRLGADVPFFLDPCPCRAGGIGEELQPVACAGSLSLVLVNPGFPVSAAWAYRAWDGQDVPAPASASDALLDGLVAGDVTEVAGACYNALEHALLRKFPVLEMIAEFLVANGCACAHVSGSGPTVFGIRGDGAQHSLLPAIEAEFGPCVWAWEGTAGLSH